MRINKFVAQATGMSRRAADAVVTENRVTINGKPALAGSQVAPDDTVTLDGAMLAVDAAITTIGLHKPVGYVVSRNGQGSPTVYELLPPELGHLKPVGRLDKESSGLLILTNDGDLAHELTHPSRHKQKVYEITLDQDLQPLHRQMINDTGISLEDGLSKLALERHHEGNDRQWIVSMHEGRNRQIRRTFAALGYNIVRLHRTQFGIWNISSLASGKFAPLD